MGVMTFSLVSYGELIYSPAADASTDFVRAMVRGTLALLSLPVLVLLGFPLVKGAWLEARAGRARMDGLIVLASFAAYGLSVHNTFSGDGEVWFETATMVLVLVMFGRRLEAHARTHGKDAARALEKCLPERAHRVESGNLTRDVNPSELNQEDRVRLLPGEAAPADLEILEGQSAMAAAHLTGEERSQPVGVGDPVPAGAVNGPGALLCRVTATARDGSLGRIMRLLEEPPPTTRTSRLVDRIASYLVGVAVALAIIGGLRSGLHGGAGAGIRTGLAVLLVACPCALGLAIPLAWRAIRAALARQGVLVRDPAALEVIPTIGTVLLDKTGTLTLPQGLQMHAGADHALKMRSLMRDSGHILGSFAAQGGPEPRNLKALPGKGVLAEIEGVPCQVGLPDWIEQTGAEWDPDVRSTLGAAQETGGTLVAYAERGRVCALASIQHELRPDARIAVDRLLQRGLQLEILSGDREEAVSAVGAALGIQSRARLGPEQKVERVRELQATGQRVLMVGDGINDSPALRGADVAVAVAAGTRAARSQAQVEILDESLLGLPTLFEASKLLQRTVRGNLLWTLFYNGIALALATMGLLDPLLAAAAMIASSLMVSVRSYRLLTFGEVNP